MVEQRCRVEAISGSGGFLFDEVFANVGPFIVDVDESRPRRTYRYHDMTFVLDKRIGLLDQWFHSKERLDLKVTFVDENGKPIVDWGYLVFQAVPVAYDQKDGRERLRVEVDLWERSKS